MVTKRIGLKPIKGGLWRAFSGNYVWTHNDENPWRAICIAYLKEFEYYANIGAAL